ncbi:Rcd1 domain-containing protein, partial [Cephalotus follicularis]
LFQCVASHPDTKMKFLQANIPFYLYPLLNTTNKEKPYEYIRVTALGVIGALVKTDDADVITSLLETQVFPHFLRCMEMENILSKTVSTFIVNKILQNDEGLKYCCAMAERFFAVGNVLLKLVENLAVARAPDKRLLKHVICCYQRLSENPRACDGLTACFPAKLRENTLVDVIRVS